MEIIEYKEIDSTNDELRRLAEKGAANFTVVTAKKQIRGKGRYSRSWESPEGNIYLSILLRNLDVHTAHQVSFVASLAALEAIQINLPEAEIRLKWPNDVLANGKKIAGILLESASNSSRPHTLQYLIIGFGINVKKSPDYATNMKTLGNEENFAKIKNKLLEEFSKYYEMWLEDGFGKISSLWLKNASGLGEKIVANLEEKHVEGIFRGLTSNGELKLETNEGEKIISSGEVHAI